MRYFLVRLTGTGTQDDPYRPLLPAGTQYSAAIPSLPDGTPRYAWCLAAIEAADYAVIDASADVRSLPANIDALWSTVPMATRNAIASAISQRLGIAVSVGDGEMLPSRAVRFLIRQVGRHLDGDLFHEDALRVG